MKPGKYKHYYTLDTLIRSGRRIAADCTTVSFDLFDTLFVRRVHDPDLLKTAVAQFVAEKARERGIDVSPGKVQFLRDSFEISQRKETGKQFTDHEACYPIYMGQMLAEIFGEDDKERLLAQVTDFELAVESSMLVPRKLLVDWLKELHDQGKTTLIMSDIYLPAKNRITSYNVCYTKLLRLIAPLGFCLGMPFALGIASSYDKGKGAVGWAWAVNGLFTVLGSVFSILLAIYIGFTATLYLAFGLYILAGFLLPRFAGNQV